MWYLYSLIVSYFFAVLLIVKIVNQAEYKGTPLTDGQTCVMALSMMIAFSIPLLNVIFSIEVVCSLLFKPYELENEIDGLIDHIRRNIS